MPSRELSRCIGRSWSDGSVKIIGNGDLLKKVGQLTHKRQKSRSSFLERNDKETTMDLKYASTQFRSSISHRYMPRERMRATKEYTQPNKH
jgi:hypothetical protein